MKDIYDILREVKRRSDETFALATLVRAHGSSYRRPGARMVICEDGLTIGSLSGGCLEEEVAMRAHDVLCTGESAMMSFDTRKRFGCNGKIDILIERVSQNFFANIGADFELRRTHVAITTFDECEFIQEIHPPIRLLLFGDGPDTGSLVSLGRLLGWETFQLSDPNGMEPDDRTAVIVKSHNYGRDFAALQKLLPLNLRYLGLIGPRKRRDQLLNDLLEVDIAINAGFFAPAGLDLGAETPEEIALAIISEIQRVFAHGSGFSLRERKMSIHAAECKIPAR